MGGQISSTAKLSDNEYLRRFTGLQPIAEDDSFWDELLAFSFVAPSNRIDCKYLEDSVRDASEALLYNSVTTGNFASFVRCFLRLSEELFRQVCDQNFTLLAKTGNALLILCYCCKYFAEHLTETEFNHIFSKSVLHADGTLEILAQNEDGFSCSLEKVVNVLAEIIIDLPPHKLTSRTQVQALNSLLCMLSTEMYCDKVTPCQVVQFLMGGKCSIHAPVLTKTLLKNYMKTVGEGMDDSSNQYFGGGSIVIGLATTLFNFLQLGYSSDADSVDSEDLSLTNQSLRLLLLLVCYYSRNETQNPYRLALFSFYNSQELSSLTPPSQAVATFKLSYPALYQKLCSSSSEPMPLLLLYFLLHKNVGFRNFLLSRVDIENLVLPLLSILYNSCAETVDAFGCHHLYVALIAMLILSEDDFFCKIIHEISLKSVPWYSERPRDLSLGSLVILVLVKSVQHNMSRRRDRYLQTNCLAALANMSAYFKNLPAFVCQKLISLLDVLSKRHARLLEHVRLSAEYDLSQAQEAQSSEFLMQDIAALEEAMRMLLEIFNCTLTYSMAHNAHLIYAMLYEKGLFESFQQHPMFQDLIWNIIMVLNHFVTRLNDMDKNASVEQIVQEIQKGAVQWPSDRLKKFPELKFKYIEDKNTDEFFIPYIWSLIFKDCGFYFDPTKIKLFTS